MIMNTHPRVRLIHSGKIQPSLPTSMTSLVGRMEETVPLPRKSETFVSTTSKLLITSLPVSSSVLLMTTVTTPQELTMH